MDTLDFLVDRADLHRCRFAAGPPPEEIELAEGQVQLAIDRFALTANNITYADLGDRLSYWGFFPGPEGWGRIPTWGFADVVRSRHDAIAPGERFFGYVPMSTHLVVTPDQVGTAGFVDAAAHRPSWSVIYNRYLRVARGSDDEVETMLLRPLFATAVLLEDFLGGNGLFGARAVVVSSASSKTSLALAFLLSRRGEPMVWGLTSAANERFVTELGWYGRVLRYDRVGELPVDVPFVYLDMAGDEALRAAVHRRLGASLRRSFRIGYTHRDRGEPAADLPGPSPEIFSTGAHMTSRSAGFPQRLADAWREFVPAVRAWMRVVESRGPEAVERAYREVLAGRAGPDEGQVLSLWSAGDM